MLRCVFFFFKQKTAYEMRISDWSSDVCSSDLEVGRIERTLFMIDWILDAGLQRQAQIGLNKGEAHHALKRAISFHRRGEIRDRSGEGQHYRIAGMNLLAAIIIFWNTMKLGEVVNTRAASGTHIEPDLLAHVSPLGWEHINLTGEYRWPKSLA